jgi:hypothetical protein
MDGSVQRGWMNGLGRRLSLSRIELVSSNWFSIDPDTEIVVGGLLLSLMPAWYICAIPHILAFVYKVSPRSKC